MAKALKIDNFFLCVGAQKAGTTWLARTLSRHPEIFVTPVKEIHYFDHIAGLTTHLSDRKRRSRYRKYHQRLWTQWNRWGELWAQRDWYRAYMREPMDDAWYASLFALRGGRKMAGEATPEYAIIGPDGFAHVARLAPRARILYLMRSPVTRAWSQILHQCRRDRRDAARMAPEALLALTRAERFEALADYERALDAIASAFPDDQVWLGYYEDIHADRLTALEEICAFLGVGFDRARFPDLARRYNVSQEVAMPDAVRSALRERYRAMAARIERRIGRVPDEWRQEYGLSAPRARPGAGGRKRKVPARG